MYDLNLNDSIPAVRCLPARDRRLLAVLSPRCRAVLAADIALSSVDADYAMPQRYALLGLAALASVPSAYSRVAFEECGRALVGGSVMGVWGNVPSYYWVQRRLLELADLGLFLVLKKNMEVLDRVPALTAAIKKQVIGFGAQPGSMVPRVIVVTPVSNLVYSPTFNENGAKCGPDLVAPVASSWLPDYILNTWRE